MVVGPGRCRQMTRTVFFGTNGQRPKEALSEPDRRDRHSGARLRPRNAAATRRVAIPNPPGTTAQSLYTVGVVVSSGSRRSPLVENKTGHAGRRSLHGRCCLGPRAWALPRSRCGSDLWHPGHRDAAQFGPDAYPMNLIRPARYHSFGVGQHHTSRRCAGGARGPGRQSLDGPTVPLCNANRTARPERSAQTPWVGRPPPPGGHSPASLYRPSPPTRRASAARGGRSPGATQVASPGNEGVDSPPDG